jgi:hypothetical protein
LSLVRLVGTFAAQHFSNQQRTERDHQWLGDVAAGNGIVKQSDCGSPCQCCPSHAHNDSFGLNFNLAGAFRNHQFQVGLSFA